MEQLTVPAKDAQKVESALTQVYADKMIGPWLQAQDINVKQALVNALLKISDKYDLKDAMKIAITNEILTPSNVSQDAKDVVGGVTSGLTSLIK